MPNEIHGVATAGNNSPIPDSSTNRGRVPKFPGFVGSKKMRNTFFSKHFQIPGKEEPLLPVGGNYRRVPAAGIGVVAC